MAHGMKLAGVGVVLGTLGAVGVARMMTSLLYEVTPTDPWVLGITCLAVLGSAAAACYVPARWAARVDPMVTLRAS
jgi:ABC-type lipoprotein release transport system permease subunit